MMVPCLATTSTAKTQHTNDNTAEPGIRKCRLLNQVPFWCRLYLSVNWHGIPKRASNRCASACLLSIIPNDWLQFLTAWVALSSSLKRSFVLVACVLPKLCGLSFLSLCSCFGILCLLFQLHERLRTFVLWISWLQTLKDFYVPKCSCYRFYPAIWCAIWHADGTDETTLQAVNVDSQNRKLEGNI